MGLQDICGQIVFMFRSFTNLPRGKKDFCKNEGYSNLVPRSLVDEADGEIWQNKKICFS